MKFFATLQGEEIHIAPGKKVIPAAEFETLLEAKELLNKVEEEAKNYRIEVTKECEILKEEAERTGFEAGLAKWNEQLEYMTKETTRIQGEMEEALVPLALAAVKRIIGHELEVHPETIVDIVSTAVKSVSQHHRVTIYVNKADLDYVEESRAKIKGLFEHLQVLSIAPRDDVETGGCIIETEVGIINAKLDHQMKALETAFHTLLKNHKKKDEE